MAYPRGSEWRRWDIHIHTPETMKNDQFDGSTREEKWDLYYKSMATYIGDGTDPKHHISVLGITDYFSIFNYERVIEENRLPETVDLVLPNVELRMTPVTGSGSPINIHCIFDPSISDGLESRFFTQLRFMGGGVSYNAGREELIRYGRNLAGDDYLREGLAIKRAIQETVVSFDNISNVFTNDPELRNRTVIAVSNGSKDGVRGCRAHMDYLEDRRSQLESLIVSIYQFADIIFSGNPKDRDYFLGLNEKYDKGYIEKKYGFLKPCFHGSDAHTNSHIFAPVRSILLGEG